MKRLTALILTCGFLGVTGALAQAPAPAAGSTTNVSRTAKAANYRRAGGSTRVEFHGTELSKSASGEAKVETKGGRVNIDAKMEGLDSATKFGLEYLTYVLWAISPQGRAVNLGELVVTGGKSHLKADTDLLTFGMIVTAEPYYAVTQPGNMVVMENVFGADAAGKVENIDMKYDLLERGAYSSSNTKIQDAIFGMDPRTPLELFEARNALRIANIALADKYAPQALARAQQQLSGAEDAYRQHRDRKVVESAAREAVQTAEDARAMAAKQKAEEDAKAKELAEKKEAEEREAKARALAEAELQRRQEAEKARVQAEQAKAEAEKMKQEAEKAAAEAARQKAEADVAKAAALQQQQAAQADAEKARQAAEQAAKEKAEADAARVAAQSDAEKSRLAAQQAESEKAELRKRLLNQLNLILQTRDTARGLIVNMSDVLFDSGSYTLMPAAREKLAKMAGIVLAYPGLNLQVEGHTDSVGSDEMNQRLSERRAESVRDYLVMQGVPSGTVSSRGFGKTQPVATNDTSEGRAQNRRVELVVSGEAIGSRLEAPKSTP